MKVTTNQNLCKTEKHPQRRYKRDASFTSHLGHAGSETSLGNAQLLCPTCLRKLETRTAPQTELAALFQVSFLLSPPPSSRTVVYHTTEIASAKGPLILNNKQINTLNTLLNLLSSLNHHNENFLETRLLQRSLPLPPLHAWIIKIFGFSWSAGQFLLLNISKMSSRLTFSPSFILIKPFSPWDMRVTMQQPISSLIVFSSSRNDVIFPSNSCKIG